MFYANTFPTMTKIDLLLKAVADPGQFPPEELEAILADPEMRRLYNLLSHAADAAAQPSDTDIDAEWNRFAATHQAVKRSSRFAAWRRRVPMRAAASVIIVFAIAAVAAGVAFTRHASTERKAKVETAMNHQTAKSLVDNVAETPDTILAGSPDAPQLIFENETLEAILTRIAAQHEAYVDFRSDAPRSLRLYFKWHQSQPLRQTVELLNGFDQIDISLHNDTITVF